MDDELEYLDSLNIEQQEEPKKNQVLTLAFWKEVIMKVYMFFYLFFYSLIFGQHIERPSENEPSRDNRRGVNPHTNIRRGGGLHFRYRSRGGG